MATVLLMLLPIGVASIRFILLTQPASSFFICNGIASLFNLALIAGYNDSSIKVVLPLPDIPVIVVNLPLGMSMVSGFTV